jgi:hypothetical protein
MHINIDGRKIDTEEFAEFCDLGLMQDGVTIRKEAREAYPFHFGNWVTTSLVAVTESGAYVLTPRGADLRASLSLLTTPTKSEIAAKSCSKCNGTGEQPLFVSMETCDRCKGSKVEPRTAADIIADYGTKLHLQAFGRVNREQSARVFVYPRSDRRTPAQQGSAEVNSILCHFLMSGRKTPERVGELDPALVCKAWTDRGSPMLDAHIVFNMAWLNEPEFDRTVRQ